jgi:hypothetical protein
MDHISTMDRKEAEVCAWSTVMKFQVRRWVRREKVENETAGETCAGNSKVCTHVQPVIYSMLTVTPLSLKALEFERARLVSFYSSFAYSPLFRDDGSDSFD